MPFYPLPDHYAEAMEGYQRMTVLDTTDSYRPERLTLLLVIRAYRQGVCARVSLSGFLRAAYIARTRMEEDA